jgi:hypothetical protein
METDGLADAAMVHSADTMKICNLFGADSVLYASIGAERSTPVTTPPG